MNTEDPEPRALRSRSWFDDPAHPDMSALYLERYTNFGLSVAELQSNRPIIGIAQTGSDLSPCNRHHLVLAQRIKEGIRDAGGIPLEFPVHPIQETGKRPTAALDRNLAYLGLVEILHGYPLDGVVLTTGCDKTVPACLMAAATVNLPAISLSVGPMLNGWDRGQRVGAGTIIWKARESLATGEIDRHGFARSVAAGTPSAGHCNTMGTALTMNSLAEALGMSLPGSAAIPAPHRDRLECAYETGRQIVEMVWRDRKPSDILTREAFLNAIRVNTAIGGSTNVPIHLIALARHVGVQLTIDDWQTHGYDLPLLVNVMPAGEYLAEEFYRAGGVPAVVGELLRHGKLDGSVLTVNGRTLAENCADVESADPRVILPFDRPLRPTAGFRVLRGNLFESAILKTSVISPQFRERFLSNAEDPDAFEVRAVVFDGPEDYHRRIDDPSLGIDEATLLVIRGVGPVGYPGSAEVVNMQPPAALLAAGTRELPCMGDGRQSGTSGSPSVLNASPEAACGGGLALLRTGDTVRIDLRTGEANALLNADELERRRQALDAAGGFPVPDHQTPWQELQRSMVSQLQDGAVLEPAVKYQRIAQSKGLPRHSH
jgi:dihydroxy-acid dehydratase